MIESGRGVDGDSVSSLGVENGMLWWDSATQRWIVEMAISFRSNWFSQYLPITASVVDNG